VANCSRITVPSFAIASFLLASAAFLHLGDFQAAVGTAGIHDFRSAAFFGRGHQSLDRSYVHVLSADLQGSAGITIAHAFAHTGGLRLGKFDAIQAQPSKILQMRENRLYKHVLHLYPLGAVGDNQAIRPEEAQSAQFEMLGDLPHRSIAVLESHSPEVDPE